MTASYSLCTAFVKYILRDDTLTNYMDNVLNHLLRMHFYASFFGPKWIILVLIVGYPNIAFNVGIIFKLILKINK